MILVNELVVIKYAKQYHLYPENFNDISIGHELIAQKYAQHKQLYLVHYLPVNIRTS